MQVTASKYEAGYNRLKADYDDLMNLELVNKANKANLEKYKVDVKEWADKNFAQFDLSIPANVDKIDRFFNGWYENKNVRDEIALIRNVKLEINRLKIKDPDGFFKSERYLEMGAIFKELEDCQPENISKLAWQHGLAF
ncbi:hypothetical protein GCM10022392_13560 [Mucilaginibacter panaciglaebae]|uniref:Uncharacterized protein n=2 Tax=Mucilaginibacter panaciglaebae TaxID=502331 RepID=A0ABP7WMV5_9SPHI